METPRPKIAIGTLIFKDGKVLLGQRKGSGDVAGGTFGIPGGHFEHQESFIECALREISEEVGIEVENFRLVTVANVREFAPAHYVMMVLRADWKSGEPQNLEPDRCEGWAWYALDQLPSPIISGTAKGLAAISSGELLSD